MIALALYAPDSPGQAPFVATVDEPSRGAMPLVLKVGLSPAARLRSATLTFTEHIWAPSAYAPIAAQLLLKNGPLQSPSQTASDEGEGSLARLLDLRPETLIAESADVSAALEKSPRDPLLHERAAFLVGAFGLRETAHLYSDIRRGLCRLAAHLALAQALRAGGPPSRIGVLAEVLLLEGVGRQRHAERRLAAFVPSYDAERRWSTTLQIRITGDWRLLKEPRRASLAERLAQLRAVGQRMGVTQARETLQQERPEPLADWRRLLLQSGPDVEACHGEPQLALAEAFGEALQVWSLVRGAPLDADVLPIALALDPAPSPVVLENGRPLIAVLDLGLWAAFEQRHAMAQLETDQYCASGVFGLPRDVLRENLNELEHRFGTLRLFPFLLQARTRDRDVYARAQKAVSAALSQRPDLVSGTLWARLQYNSRLGDVPRDFPDYGAYFEPRVPYGTAYDVERRVGQDQPFKSWPIPAYQTSLAALAPYALALQWRVAMGRLGVGADHELVARTFGAMPEYDLGALDGLITAARDHPEAVGPLLQRQCALDLDLCSGYAHWLVEQKRDTEAAQVFWRWYRECRDRVGAANDVGWLVSYEYDQGRKPKAFALAREAAATYSATGLLILARLLEKDGQLADAQAHFKKVAERYESPGELIAFYSRHPDQPLWKAQSESLVRELFPNGLESVTLSSFSEKPSSGVVVLYTAPDGKLAPVIQKYGVNVGDVIVAAEGYRVENLLQYRVVDAYTAARGDELRLIMWAKGRGFVEIVTREPNRYIGDLDDYAP